jgi:anthranilate synthase
MTEPVSEYAVYTTQGGIQVTRHVQAVDATQALARLTCALDQRRGLLLSSSYEYPGRYQRHDVGFVDPPLSFEARGRAFELIAHNARGEALLTACALALGACPELRDLRCAPARVSGHVPGATSAFSEEERTRVPSVFSVLRALRALFASAQDSRLGLYGAFGYDLVFQFEALSMLKPRSASARDLVLYLPDEILIVDHARRTACVQRYDFEIGAVATRGLSRQTTPAPYLSATDTATSRDHAPGEFAAGVSRARQAFARGDLFEVTPSQVFSQRCPATPSRVFERLREQNPAPYGFVANLGDNEFLVGASPEMYVRVQADRVETCPIAGTIGRGCDALADARQILTLLRSDKDAAELTMCTDVDRNDKARVCVPGSVRVIGRRQIELYSRLIHTVDHVEGRLRAGYDSLDAFLTHLWAVTVTGAPKLDAMQFIEAHEKSPRGFYGAALGVIGFDGSLDTGLTLRTLHIERGVAHVRVGATLHFDSDPEAEEAECQLKASALFAALAGAACDEPRPAREAARPSLRASGLRVLLIDHRDSFVHTLADYFRQSGCVVTTLRYGFAEDEYECLAPELVVLSPGPGRPDAFGMRETLAGLLRRKLPVFGVCLGLQGMVEFCGGRLLQLATPVHGKASLVSRAAREAHPLFAGLPEPLCVGRYHSLHADVTCLPAELEALAYAASDHTLMALAHRERPWWAVQFHPESILSAENAHGLALIRNVVQLAREQASARPD